MPAQNDFACAGENRDPCAAVLDFVECGLDLGHHLGIDGVAFVGAVEGQRGQLAGEFQCQRFIHFGAPFTQLRACRDLRAVRGRNKKGRRSMSEL